MIIDKKLVERPIDWSEFDRLGEQKNRIFKVSYTEQGSPVRMYKEFQHKKHVKQLIENPLVTKVKLYVGDVVDK